MNTIKLKYWRFSFLGCWNCVSETTSVFRVVYIKAKLTFKKMIKNNWWIKELNIQEAVTVFIFCTSQDKLNSAIKSYWSELGSLVKQHCIISHSGFKSSQHSELKHFPLGIQGNLKGLLIFSSPYKWDSHIRSESCRHNIMTFLLGFFLLT